MSGFIQAHEQIRLYTVESYIQDSHTLDMHWKPFSIEPGKYCNRWDHEIIRGSVAACEIGHLIRVDWMCTGDKSAPVKKAGWPQRLANAEDAAVRPHK